MPEFLPEGLLYKTEENLRKISSEAALYESLNRGDILEAPCVVCDSKHNLIVDLNGIRGVIPRDEGALGISEGSTKDIALISRVNKPVCFIVKELYKNENGALSALLSRKTAQQRCFDEYINSLRAGEIIPAKVTHLEQFGCFVDIGCGVPSLIPIDLISVSRITHPSDRFRVGMNIKAVVKDICDGRVFLSHKELLGTWNENASLFECGETVTGIVRSIEDYGVFVELTPNLAGLAEPCADVELNRNVSVYIKAIIPEKMKIKLIIVSTADCCARENELRYFINEGRIDRWVYSTDECPKQIETIF